MPFISRPENDSFVPAGVLASLRAARPLPQLTFHELCLPLDDISAGQRPTPGLRSRLCCALRVSHPLDALIPPFTLRPCSMPQPSTGFLTFRGFPPPVAGLVSPPDRPSCRFPSAHQSTPKSRLIHVRRGSKGSRILRVRTTEAGLTRRLAGRSSRGFDPPEVLSLPGLGLVLPQSLLSWASAPR